MSRSTDGRRSRTPSADRDRSVRPRRVAVGLLAMVTAVLLTACADSSVPFPAPSTPLSSPPPSSPPRSSPSTSPDAAAPGSTPPVRYVRSGGLAGREEVLEVSPDGTAVLSVAPGERPVRSALTSAERSALATALEQTRLPTSSPGDQRPPARHRDAFSYALTVRTVTIRFHDGSVPSAVVDLVRVLQGIAQRVSVHR